MTNLTLPSGVGATRASAAVARTAVSRESFIVIDLVLLFCCVE